MALPRAALHKELAEHFGTCAVCHTHTWMGHLTLALRRAPSGAIQLCTRCAVQGRAERRPGGSGHQARHLASRACDALRFQ